MDPCPCLSPLQDSREAMVDNSPLGPQGTQLQKKWLQKAKLVGNNCCDQISALLGAIVNDSKLSSRTCIEAKSGPRSRSLNTPPLQGQGWHINSRYGNHKLIFSVLMKLTIPGIKKNGHLRPQAGVEERMRPSDMD